MTVGVAPPIVIRSPAANAPLPVTTPVTSLEPLAVVPVPVAPVFSLAVSPRAPLAVALAESVKVPAPTAAIVVLAGMPLALIASPAWKAPRVVDTPLMTFEPLARLPLPLAVVAVRENLPPVALTVIVCRSSAPVLPGPLEATSPPHVSRKWPSGSNFSTRRFDWSTT